ncbi:MAG: glycosyltransferase family 1 protein [Fervidicoccaceae archaeon]
MKLYIDGLFYKGSGIGRYYESLTKEFAKRGIEIYTCVPKRLQNDFERDFSDNRGNITPIFVDYEKFSFKGMLLQSKILKNMEKRVDIFFFPHVNLPLYVPKNTITTIHDLRPFTIYWDRNMLNKKVYCFLIKRALKHSKTIVTISKTVESELKSMFNIEGGKIKVIYEFIDDKFVNVSLKQKPILDKPYILFVGNRRKHKNLSGLIKAFSLVKNKLDHMLVIAGSKDKQFDEVDELKKDLNMEDRVVEFISPNDDVIINLYQNADLFVFPSFFEGFGLPPLEALSCNCPVISSNIPVLREILGNEIACFNPYDIEDIANKMIYGIKNKGILLKIGRERLKYFDKDKIINEYIELFSSRNT